VIVCRHEAAGSFKPGQDKHGTPYYLHRIPPGTVPVPVNVRAPQELITRAEHDFLHEVYSALLAELDLKTDSRIALQHRGFSDEEIDRRGYRSMPRSWPADHKDPFQRVVRRFGDQVLTVPGWVRQRDGKIIFPCWPGLLIPVRDPGGRIVALKHRPDRKPKKGGKYRWVTSRKHGGPSPSSVAHIPLGITAPVELVRITEGELKSDLATIRTGIPTISAPGATNWRPALIAAKALGAKTVRIAYDMDAMQKTKVADALAALAGAVKADGLGLEYERWDPHYKGLDDALQAGVAIELLRGADAEQAMASVVEKSLDGKPPNEGVDDPHRLARAYLKEHHGHVDGWTLRRYRDQWHEWNDASYRIIEDKEVNARIGITIKDEFNRANREEVHAWIMGRGKDSETGKKIPMPVTRKVTTRLIGDVAAALAGMVLVEGAIEQPAWLMEMDDEPPFPADEVLPCQNTLVHLPSVVERSAGATRPLTPLFFCPYSLDYDFDPQAGRPSEWFGFLRSVWGKDDQSIRTLQEWFGYCLGPDTSLQKILLLIGPTRSGRGTMTKVLKSLLGPANVGGIPLAALGQRFGLAPLIGKMLQVFGDVRLSDYTDLARVVENLLTISGEDHVTIDRKNRSAWDGKLGVKFVIVTNDLPELPDSSAAIVGRLVLLRLTETFRGREDLKLSAKLDQELPAILNWAIAGRARLLARGHFIQPQSGKRALQQMEEMAAPVKTFIREECEVGPQFQIERERLFRHWNWWRDANDHHEINSAIFGKYLTAAYPKIQSTRPWIDVKYEKEGKEFTVKERVRAYRGIRLRPPPEPPPKS
jgi:P4 family phage/plasmid primase-like protien